MYQAIDTSLDEHGVYTLTLNRPEKHNALGDIMMSELQHAVQQMNENPEIRLVILTATGKSFCSGGDLNSFKDAIVENREQRMERSRVLGGLYRSLYSLSKPLIGSINGPAFGAGVGLISVCDITFALPHFKFGFSETRLGLVPATFFPYIVRRIGAVNARRVMLSGATFDGEEAQRIGLIDQICANEQSLKNALATVIDGHLAAASDAMSMTKKMIETVADRNLDDAIEDVAQISADSWETREACARISQFFKKAK
ncbi:enoyl-CoA hydratase-related protein [uncultured Sneathiella sp.]|uniref:enoyl-CoA hydratase-related protein n=1 Tax=uncultured Sneathiella sp. TaxID=879315 RepID=UPI0030DBE4F9|tara:strand:- start:270 stop:1040 length:771 start_codon:yes stop_codon:yes gene_type:complete